MVLSLLAGCAAKRDSYVAPEVPVPKQFRQTLTPAAEPAPIAPADEALGSNLKFVDEMLAEWWRVLGSRELDSLMDRTIANNPDVRIATLRIAQAKARSEQARADELPVVSAPYEARTETPAGGAGSGSAGQKNVSRRLYQGGLRGDLRLDVWGERQAMAESAEMQLWRSIYQRDDTRRTVTASVVSQYVEYLSLNDRLRVARETEIVLRGMLESVGERLKGGDATITELEQQRAAVYAVQATIPGLELQRENAINSLAQLLGATPGALALSHRGMDSLTFPRILPGVPANLLLRRPDVRAIEARLLAADADIDVARTRLLPSIDLSTQVGYGSLVFSRLFQPYNLAWNSIASLSATIFDHGKRTSEVAFARAMHEEMVETYVRVLYSAIRETEDAIATVQTNAKRLGSQGAAVKAAKRAWDLSIESYREGAIDFLTLLDTERTYHRNLDEYHRISMERHKGLVNLFSALGGGVAKNAPAPARGSPPADALDSEYATRAAARAPIQFQPHALEREKGRPYWLVELAGLQDRVGVTYVWRDLTNRFPELMSDRIVLPRLQGRVANEREERTAWYRLFIAKFSTAESAGDFCNRLGTALIRCHALPSDSPSYQEALDAAPGEAVREEEASAARTAPISPRAQRAAARSAGNFATTAAPPHISPAEVPAQARPLAPTPAASVAPAPAPAPILAPTRRSPVPLVAKRQVKTEAETATSTHTEIAVAAERAREPAVAAAAATVAALAPEPAPAARTTAEPHPNAARIGYAVQLVTLFKEADAASAARHWSRRGYESYLYPVVNSKGIVQFTVRTGLYMNRDHAAAQAAEIRRTEQVFAVTVPVTLDAAGKPAAFIAPNAR